MLITSRHNPRLKQAARLRDSRGRREAGRLLVDGARETLRALQAGVTPVEAFVDDAAAGPRVDEAMRALEEHGVDIVRVAREAFAKLAFGDRADGVVLVAERPERSLNRIELPADPLVLVLEAVEKPGNLGAILRTADGAGVDAVIAVDPLVDFDIPNGIRASLGAAFRRGTAVAAFEETLEWLRGHELRALVTRPEAPAAYTSAALTGGVASVLGSEADGLDPRWDDVESLAVSLPMLGVADSLNVSATAAVLCYEARRQRDA